MDACANPFSEGRRSFLGNALGAGLAAAMVQAQVLVASMGWLQTAHAQAVDLRRDTFNGLFAFVLPGSDPYSVAQGVSTSMQEGPARPRQPSRNPVKLQRQASASV
jgi:hypothetical protein